MAIGNQPGITLDVYRHLRPESDERTRAAVDAVLDPRLADSLRTVDASSPVSETSQPFPQNQ